MTKLSDTQLTILSAAIQRDDRSAYPTGAKVSGTALEKVLKGLVSRGLLEEVAAWRGETLWRQVEDGTRLTLRATPAAEAALDPDNRASIWRHLETNTAFHVGIARIGGNRYLTEALSRVFVLCERLLHAGMALTTRPRDVLNEHQEIIKAVFSGDPEVARRVAMQQATKGRELILDALLSSASVMTAWIEIPEMRAAASGTKSELATARR